MKKIMNKNIILASAAMVVTFIACQTESSAPGKSVETIQTEGKISSIIRSPVSADGKVDSTNVAKMDFEQPIFEFGEVDEGAVVKHEFVFKNNGKVPLVIQNAHSTCGCTIPDWPKEMIAPGESGVIKVEFNTKGKSEFQEKPVIISANTYPSITKVFVRGIVHKR
ncbi:MAG: DUF1573 domain-containing protein [Bacteroidales bacterium]|nr:DUF1573 domain-containing protein [Bacteroidales bacterium]